MKNKRLLVLVVALIVLGVAFIRSDIRIVRAASTVTVGPLGMYPTIQAGVGAASPGDTVTVEPGIYVENVTIDRRLTLLGSGSGTNPLVDTIIQSAIPNLPVIAITAGGASVTDRMVLQNLRVTGATGGSGNANSGIDYSANGYTTFDNVSVVNNTGNGIAIDTTLAITDFVVQNSNLSSNGNAGLRAPASAPSIDALKILNSHLDNNSGGLTVFSQQITNWELRNSTFNDNVGAPTPFTGGYGVIIDGINGVNVVNHIIIDSCEMSRNKGTDPGGNNISSGIYVINDVGDTFSDISITNTQFKQNGNQGLALLPWNDNATMDQVNFSCNTCIETGCCVNIYDPGVITNSQLRNNNFINDGVGVNNHSPGTIDARVNWWGDASGPSGIGPGHGDAILNGGGGAVIFNPFLTSPSATCGPAITIVKKTNGTDNDVAPGPTVAVGSTVTWTYLVTNTGNVPLTNVIVTDNQGVTVSCPATTLASGDSMTCTATGAAVAGQYTNIGSVTGTPPTGSNVTASNPDHYFGSAPAITISRRPMGRTMTRRRAFVPVGSTVTWTVPTPGTSLTTCGHRQQGRRHHLPGDDAGSGASMTCTETGTALAGQYTNIGSVTGKPPVGSNVTASNPDHYFGQAPPLTLTCPANAGTVGVPYSSAVTPSGGVPAYTFMIASGTLPPGLTLNPTTGAITGTPTTAGSFIFTVKVTDSKGTTAFSSCGAACAGGIATWNFNLPSGVLSTSQTYTVNGIPITAYGFTNAGAPQALYGKNDGGIENGLGIAGTSADNEIDTNTFVQLDLNNLITSGATNAQMVVNSVQAGEKYNLYGSNTLGSIGTLLGAANRTLGNTPFAITGFPTYRYVSVRATYADVLLSSVSFTLPAGCIITIAPPPPPACAVAGTLSFSGNSATSGTAGNIRTFSLNSVNVHASAFSRTRSGGTWNTAYLGLYSGGLGVTDSSEGDGSSDRHKIDNIGGRDNYVVLEFSQPVVVDRAFLDMVGADSDMSVWIGTKTDPYNNHQTLSDALLSGFYTEENSTADITPGSRWADLNVNQKSGNIVIIAALTSDQTPEDAFKLSKLDLGCPPPPFCTAGTFAFSGNTATSGTAGNIRTFAVNGVTVKASAFSRTDSGGAWAPAYLGLYSGGLGVTDTSEGDGSNNTHKVDNIGGRNNYVLFEFSAPVVVDQAFLDIIGADSDMSAWIGTKTDPINNHLTLSDALLSSLGAREDNTTTSNRLAVGKYQRR